MRELPLREQLILFGEENGEGANEIHFKTSKMISGGEGEVLETELSIPARNNVPFGAMISWQFLYCLNSG